MKTQLPFAFSALICLTLVLHVSAFAPRSGHRVSMKIADSPAAAAAAKIAEAKAKGTLATSAHAIATNNAYAELKLSEAEAARASPPAATPSPSSISSPSAPAARPPTAPANNSTSLNSSKTTSAPVLHLNATSPSPLTVTSVTSPAKVSDSSAKTSPPLSIPNPASILEPHKADQSKEEKPLTVAAVPTNSSTPPSSSNSSAPTSSPSNSSSPAPVKLNATKEVAPVPKGAESSKQENPATSPSTSKAPSMNEDPDIGNEDEIRDATDDTPAAQHEDAQVENSDVQHNASHSASSGPTPLPRRSNKGVLDIESLESNQLTTSAASAPVMAPSLSTSSSASASTSSSSSTPSSSSTTNPSTSSTTNSTKLPGTSPPPLPIFPQQYNAHIVLEDLLEPTSENNGSLFFINSDLKSRRLRLDIQYPSQHSFANRTDHSSYVFLHPDNLKADDPLADKLVVFTHEAKLINSEANCQYSKSIRRAIRHLPNPFSDMLVMKYQSGVVAVVFPDKLTYIGTETMPDPSGAKGKTVVMHVWETSSESQLNVPGADVSLGVWDTVQNCEQKQRMIPARGFAPPPELRVRSSYSSIDFSHRPCDALKVYVEEKSGLVVKTQRVHTAPANAYEDADFNTLLHWDIMTATPEANVFSSLLPKEWRLTCLNADMRIDFSANRKYIVVKDRPDSLNVTLTAKPTEELGDVIISFAKSKIFRPEPSHLIFSAQNWNQPQRLYLYYIDDGEETSCMHVAGGGYDWLNHMSADGECLSLSVKTCEEGVPGLRCGESIKRRRRKHKNKLF